MPGFFQRSGAIQAIYLLTYMSNICSLHRYKQAPVELVGEYIMLFVVGPILMKHAHATDGHSIVHITGLQASRHYFIVVESRSKSGVSSTQNSTIGVTTRDAGDEYGAVTVLGILVGVIVITFIVGGVYYIWRRYHLHSQFHCLC